MKLVPPWRNPDLVRQDPVFILNKSLTSKFFAVSNLSRPETGQFSERPARCGMNNMNNIRQVRDEFIASVEKQFALALGGHCAATIL